MANNSRSIVRFKFIEAMILKYGCVNRVHIQRAFNLSEPSATRLISEYRNANDNGVFYDSKSRQIKPVTGFEKKFLDIESEKFLEAAQIMASKQIVQYKTVLV